MRGCTILAMLIATGAPALGAFSYGFYSIDVSVDRLTRIDVTDGSETIVQQLPQLAPGDEYYDVASSPSGEIYALSAYGRLYRIATAGATAQLMATLDNGSTSASYTALEFGPSGELFLATSDTAGGSLYTVDTQNGGLTLIGATGFLNTYCISFAPDGQMYGVTTDDAHSDVDDFVFEIIDFRQARIDTATGAATSIGSLSSPVLGQSFVDGDLVGLDNFEGAMQSVNPADGSIGSYNGIQISFFGFGSTYVVPAPSALLVPVVGATLLRRRRQRS